jgi:hypothetical protein
MIPSRLLFDLDEPEPLDVAESEAEPEHIELVDASTVAPPSTPIYQGTRKS